MSFVRPDLLPLVLLLPAVLGIALWAYGRRRRSAARALGDPALVRRLGAGDLERFPAQRLLALGAADRKSVV